MKVPSWSSYQVHLLGRDIVGVQGFKYSAKAEKEFVYGAGNEPIAIAAANKSYKFSMKLLRYELDAIIAAAKSVGKGIFEIEFDVVASRSANLVVVTDVARGCQFSDEIEFGFEQGEAMEMVELKGMFMKLENNV